MTDDEPMSAYWQHYELAKSDPRADRLAAHELSARQDEP